MKTQILQLEAHDDVISTCDKMGWSQTGRVLLVWPKRDRDSRKIWGEISGAPLNRRLDLVLVKRHAGKLGVQIALVTDDPQIRLHARLLGIPTFHSTIQAQNVHWRLHPKKGNGRIVVASEMNDQERQVHVRTITQLLAAGRTLPKIIQPQHPAIRAGLFGVAILSLLALAAMVMPQAKVQLTARNRTQEIVLNVTAGSGIKQVSLSGELPAQIMNVIVEGRDTITTTGSLQVPEKASTGQVRFTNLTDQNVPIPAGQVVATLPEENNQVVRFATTASGLVPAGVGNYASLPVRALNPGSSGNIPSNSLISIEGPLGLSLTSTNPFSTTGGSDLPAQAPGRQDYDQVYSRLMRKLTPIAVDELQKGISPGDYIITPTLKLVETLQSSYDPPKDASLPADSLRLTLRLKYEALVIPGKSLDWLTTRILDVSIPVQYTPIHGTEIITPLSSPKMAGENSATLRIRAERQLQANIPSNVVAEMIRGQTVDVARTLLESNINIKPNPGITLSPSWWPRLPFLPYRIQVTISP